MRKTFLLILIGLLSLAAASHRPIHIFMIGDSTMANKPLEGNPERGWGQMLHKFFSDGIIVDNHAVNGRSSKSFLDEGRWQKVLDSLQKGDYVIIQFGHNDSKPDTARHTDPQTTYRNNLIKYINETRAKGAFPILCTSIVRRKFDENGKLIDTHGEYIVVVREVAKQMNVSLLDMEQKSAKLVTDLGPEKSKELFMWVKPGIYSQVPDGKQDDTHLNEDGATKIAGLAVEAMIENNLELVKYLKDQNKQLAFPGAEGFGAYATGGRNGHVYHVINLNDSGPGSLRDAVSKPNRTVIFDVGGVIKINLRLSVKSGITIAGQTAPGDGIVIYGNSVSFSGSDNVIVRYIRFHGSIEMSKGACTVIADNANNIIIDHCSVTWGRWDNLHIKNSTNITLQYCIIGEGIDPQRFGALLENPSNLTIHHCLWINNQSRNPKAKAGIQFYNNIIYNWGSGGFVGGHSEAEHYQDIVNNYFIAGPNSSDTYLSMFLATDHVYQTGNYADLNKNGLLDGIPVASGVFVNTKATLEPAPHNLSPVPVKLESAAEAFKTVLDHAGASLIRDSVDIRLLNHLKSLGTKGLIINSENEVGGQGTLQSGAAPKDKDQDGMPDEWEIKQKLNPDDPSDGIEDQNGDGYSNLEEFLNVLVIEKSHLK
jgi:lysophospholipase L1-like esterase/pectate lyase